MFNAQDAYIVVEQKGPRYDLHYFNDSDHASAWVKVYHREDAKHFAPAYGHYSGTLHLTIDHRYERDAAVDAEIERTLAARDQKAAARETRRASKPVQPQPITPAAQRRLDRIHAAVVEMGQRPVYQGLWSNRPRDF